MSPRIPHDHSTLTVTEVLSVDGPVRQMRAHRAHDVTLLVTEGIVYLVLEDDELVLTPGDTATIPAGAVHRFFNAGDEDAQISATYERLPSASERPRLVDRVPALAAAGCA
jgi:quercetin dioxygenase-like cupin family protein